MRYSQFALKAKNKLHHSYVQISKRSCCCWSGEMPPSLPEWSSDDVQRVPQPGPLCPEKGDKKLERTELISASQQIHDLLMM